MKRCRYVLFQEAPRTPACRQAGNVRGLLRSFSEAEDRSDLNLSSRLCEKRNDKAIKPVIPSEVPAGYEIEGSYIKIPPQIEPMPPDINESQLITIFPPDYFLITFEHSGWKRAAFTIR